jgi:hypothetical protein
MLCSSLSVRSGRAFTSPGARGENARGYSVFPAASPGIHPLVTRPVDETGAAPEDAVPAEQPRGGEQELARGRVEQTPFSMISWVGVVIGASVVLVLALVVVAYVVA